MLKRLTGINKRLSDLRSGLIEVSRLGSRESSAITDVTTGSL
jgi:hypothetical protein